MIKDDGDFRKIAKSGAYYIDGSYGLKAWTNC
jgi:hypothetical protein